MSLIKSVLVTIAYTMVNPINLLLLCIVGVILYIKNKEINNITKKILGVTSKTTIELVISQMVLGIIAGIIISILMAIFGVSFYENSCIEIILLITLATIFSKNGGINYVYTSVLLGGVSIVLEYININNFIMVNIYSLFLFLSFYIIVEGILILIDGRTGAIPIFKKTKGKIVGGFLFNRIWIMPMAIMINFQQGMYGGVKLLVTTDVSWWPLMKIVPIAQFMTIGLIALYGKSGYKNITFTQSKGEKIFISGGLNIVYGVSLFFIILIVSKEKLGNILILLYALSAYKLKIMYENYLEERKEFRYLSDNKGLVVLEVASNMIAHSSGIKSGDKIIAINNRVIKNEAEFNLYTRYCNEIITVSVKTNNDIIKEHKVDLRNKRLGLLVVPTLDY